MFVGAVARRPIVVVLMPVSLADGRRVDISVATLASHFNRVFADQKLPPTWTGVILDGSARVVARSRQGALYVGHSATPDMLARMRRSASGVARTRTLDGVRTVSAHNIMPGYRWTVIVGVPRSEFAGAARGSLYLGLGISVVLLALGLALAARAGEGVAAPVEALARAARAWSRRELVSVAPSGIDETDALAAAFAEAVGAVEAREAELRDLNVSLEARVEERTRELEKATEGLIQAQRLEAMGRLTGGVAHDFNNILMIASSGLQLMDRTDDPARRNCWPSPGAKRCGPRPSTSGVASRACAYCSTARSARTSRSRSNAPPTCGPSTSTRSSSNWRCSTSR
jgi:signal transduction histidine kinase